MSQIKTYNISKFYRKTTIDVSNVDVQKLPLTNFKNKPLINYFDKIKE